jgi:hypothetical protein
LTPSRTAPARISVSSKRDAPADDRRTRVAPSGWHGMRRRAGERRRRRPAAASRSWPDRACSRPPNPRRAPQ